MAKTSSTKPRKPHDMGGDPAGPVDRHEHVPTLTERRIDAMMQLLRAKPRAYWVTDENRRTIESLTPDTYRAAKYYEKWAYAMRGLLIEKGVVSEDELVAKLAEVKKRVGSGKAKDARGAAKAATSKPVKPVAKKAASKAKVPARTAAKSKAGARS